MSGTLWSPFIKVTAPVIYLKLFQLFTGLFFVPGQTNLPPMRYPYLLLPALLLLPRLLTAQNLVPNPSFEDPSIKKTIHRFSLHKPMGYEIVKNWYMPTRGTSDYYNTSHSTTAGYATPVAHTGTGRIGMIAARGAFQGNDSRYDNYKEYITARLTEPLVKDSIYVVSFYVVLDRISRYAEKNIGILLHDGPVMENTYNAFGSEGLAVSTPKGEYFTETTKWTKISAQYKAKGGEDYLVLGSFGPSRPQLVSQLPPYRKVMWRPSGVTQMAYYFIDDVSVIPLHALAPEPPAEEHTVFLVDDSQSMKDSSNLQDMTKALKSLVKNIPDEDKISVITFSDEARIIVENVPGAKRKEISKALSKIKSHGGTNISAGLEQAYALARRNTDSLTVTHVILATDGKFSLNKLQTENIRKAYADEHISFSVMQFGKSKSDALVKLSQECGGDYEFAQRGDLDETLKKNVRTGSDKVRYGHTNVLRKIWKVTPRLVFYAGIVLLYIYRAH